jgi:C-terminal processing protease CtpA/Prc
MLACITLTALSSARLRAQSMAVLDVLELEVSYDTLTQQYYRPVSAQQVADGARTGIVAYLVSRRIAMPRVPFIRAAAGNDATLHAIERAVAETILRYGSRVAPRALVYATIGGELATVHDPYTVLFTPAEYAKFNRFLSAPPPKGTPAPTVYPRLLPGGVGYVKLTVFGDRSAEELRQALEGLDAQGARSTVLDLRDNGGGYRDTAIKVAATFILHGPIVTVEEQHGKRTAYSADGSALPVRPLVVLVNGNTASASEIVAAAIQDDRAGTIEGTQTFGKGVVQTIFPLPDGSAMKVTTGRYFTALGRNIDHTGVTPDVVLDEPASARPGDPENDPQLDRARALVK